MTIRLFDINNGVVIPTEHCYTLKFLKTIMDNYPDNHLKIYSYLFYMTCPNPDMNPYFHMPESDKEEVILQDIDADFSSEDEDIQIALDKCRNMYETPTSRAYYGMQKALDRISKYLADRPITDGKDGNIAQIRGLAKDFDNIRQSFKGVYKDLQEEQQSHVRGGAGLAYDQMK
jgi:hypothetical protein